MRRDARRRQRAVSGAQRPANGRWRPVKCEGRREPGERKRAREERRSLAVEIRTEGAVAFARNAERVHCGCPARPTEMPHPGIFGKECANDWKEWRCVLLIAKRAKERGQNGVKTNCNIGNPDGYQKKGVAGEAKRIVVKTKGIANLAQIGKRGCRGRRVGPSRTSLGVNKSEVGQFEGSLITLVSVS